VLAKAEAFGIKLDKNDATCRHILQQMKELEQNGYQFEAAEASFELLMRDAMGDRPKFFALSGFRVDSDSDPDGNVHVVAIIKVQVKGEEKLIASEGNGPISALDSALRKALAEFYPAIKFHLTDYKVRILNSNDGTSAKTRVLIESSNGEKRWNTVGVSSNIIAASYQALVEGLEYGLILAGAKEPIVTANLSN
jgi:2-isopropylmalate synthase